ncbi:hypothetical protein RIF29_27048 [Crotalaria pallida]|uniref:Uncharacterized protein n=1 Tax=Crotalaria pallida TaxID=3830 RepID=A0AAN9ENZ7_CROPI
MSTILTVASANVILESESIFLMKTKHAISLLEFLNVCESLKFYGNVAKNSWSRASMTEAKGKCRYIQV